MMRNSFEPDQTEVDEFTVSVGGCSGKLPVYTWRRGPALLKARFANLGENFDPGGMVEWSMVAVLRINASVLVLVTARQLVAITVSTTGWIRGNCRRRLRTRSRRQVVDGKQPWCLF